MAGEIEAGKAAAEAAKAVVAADPILGSLLVLAGVTIAALAWYVRSLHNKRDDLEGRHAEERDRWQEQLTEIQEKRVQIAQAYASSLADSTAVLTKVTDTLQGMARSTESSGLALRDLAQESRAAFTAAKEGRDRIEKEVDALAVEMRRAITMPHRMIGAGQ